MPRDPLATRDDGPLITQIEGWRAYGWPGQLKARGSTRCLTAVPEVGYIADWHAGQMTRLDWRIQIGGSDDWAVKLDTGETITVADYANADDPNLEASRALLARVDWTPENIAAATVNNIIAGEFWYLETGGVWGVVSVVDPNRVALHKAATRRVHALREHPAARGYPNAPIARALDVIDDLSTLATLSRTQNVNIVTQRGVVVASDQCAAAQDGNFWDAWDKMSSASLENLDTIGAVQLRAPEGQVQDAIKWTIPNFPHDDRIDKRITAGIYRLAYGLPIPPEILLGMSGVSRANAAMIERSGYRAHIEPDAKVLAHCPEQALGLILEGVDTRDIEVIPDPTEMLTPVETVAEERDTPEAPVTAATKPAEAPQTGRSLETMAAALDELDARAREALQAATAQTIDRIAERIGARIRSDQTLRSTIPKDVRNRDVWAHTPYGVLTAVELAEVINAACHSLTKWWTRYARGVVEQADQLTALKTADTASVVEAIDRSRIHLEAGMHEHVKTVWGTDPSPLPMREVRRVLSVAGGD